MAAHIYFLNSGPPVRNMPVMLIDPFGLCPPVAQNRESIDSQDSKSGGPSATDSADLAEADPQGAAGGSCQSAPWYYGGGGGVSIDGGEPFAPGDGAGGLLGNSNSTIPCQSGSCRLDSDGNFIGPVYVPSRIAFQVFCDGPKSDPNVNCKNLTLVLPSEYQFGVTGNQSAYPNDGSILSQIMNNPSLAGDWTRTMNGAQQAVYVGMAVTAPNYAVMAGAVAGDVLDTAGENLRVLGPSPGFAFGQGRAFGILWDDTFLIRLDRHSLAPGGPPIWHLHLFSEGGEHGFVIPFGW
jgi:hypothetical protein